VRYAALEAWTRRHFPSAEAVVHRWSGQVLETIDGLAFIGPTPSGPMNLLMVSGDSGMGLTHGTIAGTLLTDRMAGRENPWARFYDPSRKPLAAAARYLRENVAGSLGYASWLKPGDGDPASLSCDSGGVFGWGPDKRAIYRDPNGTLHVRSAVCPHLGGVVGWNDAEKTWECPCHGSSFDRYGRVIQGPANADLEPVKT
jgi:Rieske Fe-S protein